MASLAFYRDGLNVTLDCTVQLELEMTNALRVEISRGAELTSLPIGSEGKRVVTTAGLKPRITHFYPCFMTSEKCYEGAVDPAQYIPRDREIWDRKIASSPNFFQLAILIEESHSMMSELPRVPALLECGVVERARLIDLSIKRSGLKPSGIEAVLEGAAL